MKKIFSSLTSLGLAQGQKCGTPNEVTYALVDSLLHELANYSNVSRKCFLRIFLIANLIQKLQFCRL